MARTSLVISIAFTGFIMLSIAQMALGVSRYNQVVGASEPHETANAERAGTLVAGANVSNGLANANRHGEEDVDLNKGQVNSDTQTGGNAAGADVSRDGYTRVDLKNGKVKKGGENKVEAANGLVDVKKGGGAGVDLKKGEVHRGGETAGNVGNVYFGGPANKNHLEPENSYPADNHVPATEHTDGSYN
ncbi:hypothetical protein MKW92_051627 [Papaver armeniacum]|nr:hypothetical protein MKW92_051627 [Papaver armeniacum]